MLAEAPATCLSTSNRTRGKLRQSWLCLEVIEKMWRKYFFCCEWVSAKVQERGLGGRSYSFQGPFRSPTLTPARKVRNVLESAISCLRVDEFPPGGLST